MKFFYYYLIGMWKLLFSVWLVYSQAIYDTSLYQLGTEVVANGDFSSPTIPAGTAYTVVAGTIQGWTCST